MERFTVVLFLGFIVIILGCSNSSSPTTNKPAAPTGPQKLTFPNLQCYGKTLSGSTLTIDAEISDIHPSEQQPNQVLFGTSNVLVTIDEKTDDSRSKLFTVIGYLVQMGGYISSVSIGNFNQSTGTEWSLWVENDLTKSEFTLFKKERLTSGITQSKEIGNVICKFTWEI